MKISIISNIYLEPFVSQCLKKSLSLCGECLKIEYINYQEFMTDEYKLEFNNFDLYIIIINQEKLRIANKKHLYNIVEKTYIKIKNNCNKQIIVFGYENYYDSLNKVLGCVYEISKNIDYANYKIAKFIDNSDSFIDLKHLIAEIGINNAYNIQNKYRWDSPYSKELIEKISNEIHKQCLINKGITKKCVILDCDNVLWGGFLSEQGIDNIKLNDYGIWSIYQDFQRFIVDLYKRGVVITICSKNNLLDIKSVFNNHKSMVLKDKHISLYKANWNNKVENIREISKELNISLDSLIFIDDSIEEINQVNNFLPEIKTIHFDIKKYREYNYFLNLKNNSNIKMINYRTNNYKKNHLRDNLKEKSCSHKEFITKLNVKVNIQKATFNELSRISELSQRTNKITNGKRLAISELRDLYNNNKSNIYSVYVKDKFSNYGLVGAIIFIENELILFSMSCRVIGLDVEEYMINYVEKIEKKCNVLFIDTGKNEYIKAKLLKK